MTAAEKTRFIANRNLTAEMGQRWYEKLYREEYELLHPHKYLSIDVESGKAGLGSSLTESINEAKKVAPDGWFFTIRIGHRAAVVHRR